MDILYESCTPMEQYIPSPTAKVGLYSNDLPEPGKDLAFWRCVLLHYIFYYIIFYYYYYL